MSARKEKITFGIRIYLNGGAVICERRGYRLSKNFAADKRGRRYWAVTHIKSGFSAGWAHTLKRAGEYAEALEGCGVRWAVVNYQPGKPILSERQLKKFFGVAGYFVPRSIV